MRNGISVRLRTSPCRCGHTRLGSCGKHIEIVARYSRDMHASYPTARSLARSIAAGELSPVTAVEASLARLDETEPKLRSFVTVLADTAMQAARHAEAQLSTRAARGALFGVPISVKD